MRRPEFNPWVWEDPLEKKATHFSILLGEFLGLYSPWGHKESDTTERLSLFFQGASVFWFHGCSHCPHWFWSPEKKSCHCFHCFPICLPWVMGPDAMILVVWMLSFKPVFSLSSFTFIKRLFSSSLSAIRVVSSTYLRLLIFLPDVLLSQFWFQLMLHPDWHFAWCSLHIS